MGKNILGFVKTAGIIIGAVGIGRVFGKLDAVEAFIKRTDDDRAHDRFAISTMFGSMKIEAVDKTWTISPAETAKTEE